MTAIEDLDTIEQLGDIAAHMELEAAHYLADGNDKRAFEYASYAEIIRDEQAGELLQATKEGRSGI